MKLNNDLRNISQYYDTQQQLRTWLGGGGIIKATHISKKNIFLLPFFAFAPNAYVNKFMLLFYFETKAFVPHRILK